LCDLEAAERQLLRLSRSGTLDRQVVNDLLDRLRQYRRNLLKPPVRPLAVPPVVLGGTGSLPASAPVGATGSLSASARANTGGQATRAAPAQPEETIIAETVVEVVAQPQAKPQAALPLGGTGSLPASAGATTGGQAARATPASALMHLQLGMGIAGNTLLIVSALFALVAWPPEWQGWSVTAGMPLGWMALAAVVAAVVYRLAQQGRWPTP